jgi:hypothetical protein
VLVELEGIMSLYLLKAVKARPFRVSLSGSGLGVPTGVHGLRVGTGPRGSCIRVGAHGAYYRQTLSRPLRPGQMVPCQLPQPPARLRGLPADEVLMQDVTGATTPRSAR